jgi:hypothetical protein
LSAEVGAQASQLLLVFKSFGKKFDAVQVNRPVTDFASNFNRLVSARVPEFDLDVASYRQIGSCEHTDPAFAQPDAASHDGIFFWRMIDDDPEWGVKGLALPAPAIWLLLHEFQLPAALPASSKAKCEDIVATWPRNLETIALSLFGKVTVVQPRLGLGNNLHVAGQAAG